MRHCKKSQNYPVPTSTWCVWVLALHFLVTDGSQNWQAKTRPEPPRQQDKMHWLDRLVLSYLCVLFQSRSFEEKVWGRGWKKFSRLSAQSFLQFHVWHNRLGRTRRKFEQRRNYCKFWKELFSRKCEARSIVLIKNRMGKPVLWRVCICLQSIGHPTQGARAAASLQIYCTCCSFLLQYQIAQVTHLKK